MENTSKKTTELAKRGEGENDEVAVMAGGEAEKACTARRIEGAPSNAYLYSAIAAVGACDIAIIASVGIVGQGPDVYAAFKALRQLEGAHPVCSVLATFAVAAACMALYDVLIWKFAAWAAWLRHRENVTVRRVAFWRLAVLVAFAVLVPAMFALFPAAFPQPGARARFMCSVVLVPPIVMAAAQWRRAGRR